MSHPRPLSPHLQIYKPQITSVLSILHRFTGVILCGGAVALVWWLVCLEFWETSPACYASLYEFYSGFFGKLFLLGITFAFFYHLANGMRHLVWDMGYGYDLKTMERSGWCVVACALGLTALSWALALL